MLNLNTVHLMVSDDYRRPVTPAKSEKSQAPSAFQKLKPPFFEGSMVTSLD